MSKEGTLFDIRFFKSLLVGTAPQEYFLRAPTLPLPLRPAVAAHVEVHPVALSFGQEVRIFIEQLCAILSFTYFQFLLVFSQFRQKYIDLVVLQLFIGIIKKTVNNRGCVALVTDSLHVGAEVFGSSEERCLRVGQIPGQPPGRVMAGQEAMAGAVHVAEGTGRGNHLCAVKKVAGAVEVVFVCLGFIHSAMGRMLIDITFRVVFAVMAAQTGLRLAGRGH